MAYWYPKSSRAAELTARLAKLETTFLAQADRPGDEIASLSGVLQRAEAHADFPRAQTPRWLWVASRYRIDARVRPEEAAKAAAALQLLSEIVELQQIDAGVVQELNWVLDATVRALAERAGAAGLRACLSPEELGKIDAYLHAYDDATPFDVETVRRGIAHQLDLLRSFDGVGDLTSFDTKVEALFAAATRPGSETTAARAALRYLADVTDVVGDRQGVIGLVDDIYVVEWAYAAVESQTLCLPLLEAMLERWPFVGTTGLGSQGELLDRYAQYVACAALFTLFGPGSGALVVREAGAFPVLCAIAAGLECARRQSDRFDEEMALWPVGSPVKVSDGTTTFHAIFGGRIEVAGKPRLRLAVRDRGTITVGDDVLPYISLSPRTYKRLSGGQEIASWLKDRNLDPLTVIAGNGRRRPSRHAAVLLVGPRHRLDQFLPFVRPLDSSATALLGIRWIDAQGHGHDLPGSASDCPLIYACADAATACELVAEPPEHVNSWHILVDGARLGRTVHAALSTAGRLERADLCVLAELSEREATQDLERQGLRGIWYLEDQDVVVPPLSARRPQSDEDPLGRFLLRQGNHWSAGQRVHVERDETLERLADYLTERDERDNSTTTALDLAVAGFVRRAIGQPFGSGADQEIRRVARSIAFQSAAMAPYDESAARLREFVGQLSTDGWTVGNRAEKISKIVAGAPIDATIAVVCRSEKIAQRCRETASGDARFRRASWLGMDELRRCAPYDMVIVPGWLDRHGMRELTVTGYGGRIEMVLLPFEQTWFERTNDALRRWERKLEQDTIHYLNDRADAFGQACARWREQTQRRLRPADRPQSLQKHIEELDIEQVERRALDKILASVARASSDPIVKAQLILFEAGSYALLPPQGHVIVLDAPGRAAPVGREAAERQLTMSVTQLAPGMLLALPEGGDRDLLDARADAVMKNATETRASAARWKTALRSHFARSGETFHAFAQRLRAADQPRDALTVKSWATDSRSIVPRNYRQMIPLIGRLTGDCELEREAADVAAAADQIYAARAKAADLLLREIFSGELNLAAERLVMETSSGQVSYVMHRIDQCLGVREVPSGLLGRVAKFGQLFETSELSL